MEKAERRLGGQMRTLDTTRLAAMTHLRALRAEHPDPAKFKELETFHRHLRKTNLMSLPWRAKKVIDWATS
ncbi:MAG TPA: hypothetical protein DCG57_20800, partial [Candidatus Riflebacteria bacterium]|nr:hypothetical protein [Candidatus Riflebacteria bacterium]